MLASVSLRGRLSLFVEAISAGALAQAPYLETGA
jgi:hypothetical protein